MLRTVEWFFGWVEYHQLLHPHRNWVRPHDATAMDFYAGWIQALERCGATAELCQEASRQLQASPPRFLPDHLPSLLAAIGELRKASGTAPAKFDEAPEPGLVQASIESQDCPECAGSGWARRRVYWPVLNWSPRVDLFCRCPAGRFRKANDPDLAKGDLRNHDDLQARPEVWNPILHSPLWSDRPTRPDVTCESTEDQWHYLLLGEAPPSGSDKRVMAVNTLGRPARPVAPEPAF